MICEAEISPASFGIRIPAVTIEVAVKAWFLGGRSLNSDIEPPCSLGVLTPEERFLTFPATCLVVLITPNSRVRIATREKP